MEWFTIFLSSLIGLISPTGIVLDKVAQQTIRKQFVAVEQLQVRIDNAPPHQILSGRVDRLRIAGRGLFPVKDLRLAVLEVETDPLDVNLQRLRRAPLQAPVQAGVRLVLTEADINRALGSPPITKRLKNLGIGLLRQREARQVARYDFLNPKIELLGDNRLRLWVELQEQGYPQTLKLFVETGLEVIGGRTLNLVNPQVIVDGEPLPPRILQALQESVRQRLDLQRLERSGITVRILQLDSDTDQLNLAAFVRVPPQATNRKAFRKIAINGL